MFGTVNTVGQSLILVTRDYTDKIAVKSICGASATSITGNVNLKAGNVTLNFSGNNSAIIIWWNSNKQKVLKNIGKQFDVDDKLVITTDIKRTAIIIACRSNGTLIAPFVTSNSDTWKAKVDRLNGGNVSSVYVTFFYFE